MGARVNAAIPAVTLVVSLLLAALAGAVDITECRQVVPPGEVAQLRRDLDCTSQPTFPFSAEGVHLRDGARLEMNGFTIRGDATGVGITCFDGETHPTTCTVNGPGTVSGFWAGINGAGCLLVVRGVLLQGNDYGIVGPLACDLDAEDINVVDNAEDGIQVGRMRARNLIVRGNGGRGIVARRIDAESLAATQNGREGLLQLSIRGRFGRLAYSTVIANDAGGAGYDIAAAGRLRLRSVRCGRSARLRWPRVVDSSDDVPRVVGSFGCIND